MRNAITLVVAAMLGAPIGVKADSLPIEPGYYVQRDTPCQQASNATLTLYNGTSFGDAHVECRKSVIQKAADSSYQITERCRDMQGHGGPWKAFTTSYVVLSRTEFISTTPYQKTSYRYCKQSDLPEPWSKNNLSSYGVK